MARIRCGVLVVLLSLAASPACGQGPTISLWADGKEAFRLQVRDDLEITSDNLGNYLVRLAFKSTDKLIIKGDDGDPDRATLKGRFELRLAEPSRRLSPLVKTSFNELRLVQSKSERDVWFLTKEGVALIEVAMYRERGRVWFAKRDFDKAVNDFSQALGLDPKNAEIYYERGRAHTGMKDYDDAIADFSVALRLSPNHVSAVKERDNAMLAKQMRLAVFYGLPAFVDPRPLVANLSFAEGLAFDSRGNLFFSNYARNGTIGCMTPGGDVSSWLRLPGAISGDGPFRQPFPFGLKVDARDNLIVADYGGRRLLQIGPDKAIKVLVESFEGKQFNNPNDVCLDREGNIFFTDPPGEASESVGAIYRVSIKGNLTRVYSGPGYPNGLAFSGDQKLLYVADTWEQTILAFKLDQTGTLTDKKIIHKFETPSVDGLCLDPYGRIWVARLQNKTVDVLMPDGKLLASYPAGGGRVTNLCWRAGQLFVSVAGQSTIYRWQIYGNDSR